MLSIVGSEASSLLGSLQPIKKSKKGKNKCGFMLDYRYKVNCLGSKDSRMASPIKVTRVKMRTRVPKAAVTIQGAVRRLAVPCFNNSPRLGVGTGRPKPKKSRAVMAEMAETIRVDVFEKP